jgi:hypothetical protein
MCLHVFLFFWLELSPFTSHKNSHNGGITLGSTSLHVHNHKLCIHYSHLCGEETDHNGIFGYSCFYLNDVSRQVGEPTQVSKKGILENIPCHIMEYS